QLAAAIAADHPQWGEAEYAAHFEGLSDKFAESAAYKAAMAELFGRQVVKDAIGVWAERLSTHEAWRSAVVGFVLDPRWREVWTQRVGPVTSESELVQRVDEYLVSERGAATSRALGAIVLLDPALEELVVKLVDSPELTRILARRLMLVLEDAAFQRAAIESLLVVWE